MNGHGQSDRFVVPANPLNKAAAAEAGEERERAKGNTGGETRPGRSAGLSVSSELDRVRQGLRLVQVVRGQQDRGPVRAQPPDQLPELPTRLRVEARGRLVEEEQLGRPTMPSATSSLRVRPPDRLAIRDRALSVSPTSSMASSGSRGHG